MLLAALAALALAVAAALAAVALVTRSRRHDRQLLARAAARARIGRALAEGLVEGKPLEDVLRTLIPENADWCVLNLVDESWVSRAAVVHREPAVEQQMRDIFERMPFARDAPNGPARVIRTGESELVPEFTAELAARLPSPDLLRAAGLGSSISVPLKARQRIVGALTLTRQFPHGYDKDDLLWAQELAYRIALGVENRRLYVEARELFEQTVSANFVSTPAGALLACNQTFATLLGFSSIADALATSITSLYADPGVRETLLADVRAKKRLVGYELVLRRQDGQHVTVAANGVGHFDDRGELVKITGFLADRTAERELEQQLRQAQRLEAVGQLAGGIAHDFNNLLTVIMGCIDLMKVERERHGAVVASDDPLEEISKATNRAASLTQQLLAFSRRQILQPRVVQLNDALRNIHSMLRRLTPPRLVLILDLDANVDPVRVDPGQLDQVVVNLVVNAVDATPASGTITVATRRVELTAADVARYPYVIPGRYVALTVTDTGVGMDDASRARVFEPFFTTKPVGKGTGLGLSTVFGIVKQSGGYIWISSALGAGTTVRICLPVAADTAA